MPDNFDKIKEEVKQLVSQTEASQAERRAAIGTMSAGIHHEVGNPLNVIGQGLLVFS